MTKHSRRDFLGRIGATAALAPFLPYFNGRAEAQANGSPPVRLLLLATHNGSVPAEFWPMGNDADYTFKPGSITEALAPFKSKLIFPKGMKRPRGGGGGHESAYRTMWTGAGQSGMGGGFGGYAKGPSIDQMIAKALPAGQTTFPSLQFGVQHDGPGANPTVLTVMTYSGPSQPLAPESNPYTMFDRLMLGGSGVPTGLSQEQLDRVRARRKSVLDLVADELRVLAPKVDRSDRIKLQQHVEGISAIEKRLNNPMNPGGGNSGVSVMAPRKGIDLKANESFPELLGIQSSLAVAALASDRTRVATMQWSRSFSQVRHTWVGVTSEHHTLSHMTSAANQMQKFAIEKWYAQRMAEMFRQMDQIPEGNGTLLDNCMIIYCNDLSEGAAHSVAAPITFIAGKAGGRLKSGRLLDLSTYDFTQMLVSAAHIMGATAINQVGELGKAGDIPALTT
jgi:hypothetical protein